MITSTNLVLLEDYLPIALFVVVAIVFPIATYFLTGLLRPRLPTKLKETTYECGETPIGEAQIQFHFQYYMYAIIFVAFDVVAAFLLLWALVMMDLPMVANIAVVLFVIITGVAVVYALKKEEMIWI
jgi:NADH:ubiquinone oxidoreductase subunit 3 (subunit A)